MRSKEWQMGLKVHRMADALHVSASFYRVCLAELTENVRDPAVALTRHTELSRVTRPLPPSSLPTLQKR